MAFDEVRAGWLYTNASYDPDGAWRAADEAFVQRLKDVAPRPAPQRAARPTRAWEERGVYG